MKKLEFESNGSKWFLADLNSDQGLYDLQDELGYCLEKSEKYFYVKDITEEQASEVVGDMKFHNFGNYLPTYKSKIEALLKSKGVYLYENPFDRYFGTLEYQDYEKKTFYNPILFKILK